MSLSSDFPYSARIAELEADVESLLAVVQKWFPWHWETHPSSLDVDETDIWAADLLFLSRYVAEGRLEDLALDER